MGGICATFELREEGGGSAFRGKRGGVSLICIYLMIGGGVLRRRIAVGTGAVMKFERRIARAASREADISNVTWPVPSFYANKTVERLISLGVRRRRRPLRPSFKRGRC